MPLSRPRRVVGAAVTALTVAAGAVAALASSTTSAQATITPYGSVASGGSFPTVGAIFPSGIWDAHTCTGTVTSIGGAPVVITAAHCINGGAVGWTFAPGYRDGVAPFGTWRVAAAYVDPRWNGGNGWQYDVAVLRLDKQWINGASRDISYLTGSTALRSTPGAGTLVDIMGYQHGYGGKPVVCSNTISRPGGQAFTWCSWLPTGVSGSGFRYGNDGRGHQLLGGVLGGYQQGGCKITQAYSAALGPWTANLVARANANKPGDWVPTPVWDGCTTPRG